MRYKILDKFIEVVFEEDRLKLNLVKERTENFNDYVVEDIKQFLDFYFIERIYIKTIALYILKKYEKTIKPFSYEVYKYLIRNNKIGKFFSYSQLAEEFKTHPRAIASIMRNNKLPIVVPCHKVLAKKGIGGYSQGIELKEILINFEKE